MNQTSNRLRTLRRIRARRGYLSIIGTLIVLVILMILMLQYFKEDEKTGKAQAVEYQDRAQKSACAADRNVITSQLTSMSISNGGKLPNIYVLRARLGHYRCPDKGHYLVGPNGEVYCTLHFPPPEGKPAEPLEEGFVWEPPAPAETETPATGAEGQPRPQGQPAAAAGQQAPALSQQPAALPHLPGVPQVN